MNQCWLIGNSILRNRFQRNWIMMQFLLFTNLHLKVSVIFVGLHYSVVRWASWRLESHTKQTPRLRINGPLRGNALTTDGFPSQMASNAECVFSSWRHRGLPPMAGPHSARYRGIDRSLLAVDIAPTWQSRSGGGRIRTWISDQWL